MKTTVRLKLLSLQEETWQIQRAYWKLSLVITTRAHGFACMCAQLYKFYSEMTSTCKSLILLGKKCPPYPSSWHS